MNILITNANGFIVHYAKRYLLMDGRLGAKAEVRGHRSGKEQKKMSKL